MSLFTFYAQNMKACIIPAGIVSILVSDSTLGCDISIVSDVDKFETPQIYMPHFSRAFYVQEGHKSHVVQLPTCKNDNSKYSFETENFFSE